VAGLHEGRTRAELCARFEDFLSWFRPRSFGELLNLSLSRFVPLWVYPWQRGRKLNPGNGWMEDLNQVPDILTHFCEKGIRRSRIEEEYSWLDRAYRTISSEGYKPEQFSYLEVFELKDGSQSVFILKDGNHRLSALAALKHTEVLVKRSTRETVDLAQSGRWPQVLAGNYSLEDAIAVFRVYFSGVAAFQRSSQPARILPT
jgi:hypothetical protein